MKDCKKYLFTVATLLQTIPLTLLAAENAAAPAEGGEKANPLTGDTWLIAAWGKICDIAKAAWKWLEEHVRTMLIEDLGLGEADQGTVTVLIVILVILSIMLASGAWAASIAQMRRHRAPKFFLYGFFTFFVGPAHLLYSLDIKGEEEQKAAFAAAAAQKRAEAAERARLEEEQAVARGKEAPAVSAEGIVWDKNYFLSIQRKPDGTPAGPWAVQFNGISVTVLQIVEAMDENVQVKMINLEGTKTMGRIPYARLQKWDALDPAGYEEAMAEEKPQAEESAPVAAKESSADANASGWNEEYFASIRTNADGTPAGPWRVAYNGIEIEVVEIVDVLKECVQVKMINLEGMPMNGRIPYSRIEKWEAMNE